MIEWIPLYRSLSLACGRLICLLRSGILLVFWENISRVFWHFLVIFFLLPLVAFWQQLVALATFFILSSGVCLCGCVCVWQFLSILRSVMSHLIEPKIDFVVLGKLIYWPLIKIQKINPKEDEEAKRSRRKIGNKLHDSHGLWTASLALYLSLTLSLVRFQVKLATFLISKWF